MLSVGVVSPLGNHRYVTPGGAPPGYGSILSSVPLQIVVSERHCWNDGGGVPTDTVNVVGGNAVELTTEVEAAVVLMVRVMLMVFTPGEVNEVLATIPVWGAPPSITQTVFALSAAGSTS